MKQICMTQLEISNNHNTLESKQNLLKKLYPYYSLIYLLGSRHNLL
jgi:hypothetical protein